MSCSRAATAPTPLHVVRGASKAFLVTVSRAAGGPVDLSGARIWFTVKNRVEDVAPVIVKRNLAAGGVDNQVLISTPQTGINLGQFTVYIDPADTSGLSPSESYWCDIFVQLPGGPPINRQQVLRNTSFVVDPAVTTAF